MGMGMGKVKGWKKMRWSGHVIVVSLAIGYIYLSSVLVFIKAWFGLGSSPGIINALLFTALALLCISNYALAMFTDPGSVPPSFAPDIEDPLHPIHEIKRKGGDLRYCKKCCLYKPPRSHHCRICKRCVLRMDHHCVWMNNCVGHANYKLFFVFVAYALLACLYSLILLLGSLTVDTQQSEGPYRSVYVHHFRAVANSTEHGFRCFSGLAYLPNLTKQNHNRDQGGNVYSHPYDLGVYENLITVLGPNVLCWVCPVSSYIGSGLHFRTAYDRHATATTTS
ncbi:hypothetical protein M8C21_018090 [Ambrosia artemisiifolia]|uniref:S-acyltransferase n=1 Tax=Ambrosia artemisiifolia TaxID=4212 RepID=A0AAD5GLE3_AMBAR|nr:hypothetical protein M8C21_018090 [Ambrosia artemisiifolia]